MARIAVLIHVQMGSMLSQELILVGFAQSIVRHALEETAVTVVLVALLVTAYNYFYTMIRDVILAVRMVSMVVLLTISVLLVTRLVMGAHCQVTTVLNARLINLDSLAPINVEPVQMATTETPLPNHALSVQPDVPPVLLQLHAQVVLQ